MRVSAKAAVGTGLALLLGLSGCRPASDSDQAEAPPFVFRTLNLRQRDAQGVLAWELRSPEARYDLSRKLARVRRLQGLIYEKGRPLYRLSASRGVVLNDGDVALLEGPIRLERLGEQPLVISAERLRWYPKRGWMVLDRQFQATQKDLQLTALRASFDLRRNRLQIEGDPLLSALGPKAFSVNVHRVIWWSKSGALVGVGPVKGQRRSPEGSLQTLNSPGLSGNSLRQELVLAAPVQLTDSVQRARIEAGPTTILLAEQSLRSHAPFSGVRGPQSLQGMGFELQQRQTTLQVLSRCLLRQPGDLLAAGRCSWNWSSGAVQASGGVTLTRREPGLVTRAERLDGRLGDGGLVVLSRPAGAVTTTVQVKGEPAQPRRRPAAGPPFQL